MRWEKVGNALLILMCSMFDYLSAEERQHPTGISTLSDVKASLIGHVSLNLRCWPEWRNAMEEAWFSNNTGNFSSCLPCQIQICLPSLLESCSMQLWFTSSRSDGSPDGSVVTPSAGHSHQWNIYQLVDGLLFSAPFLTQSHSLTNLHTSLSGE